jgi:hypothetical protein
VRLKFKAKRSIGREIAHRIDFNGTAEAIVQRDLERYYDLLARERRKIALTRDEASLVCVAVGGANLQLDAVGSLWSWVGDFADIMGDELKSEMGEQLKVDFRKLNPKLRRLTDAQTIAVLDAADAYMLGRRWIPTGRKDIETSGLVHTLAKSRRPQGTRSPRRRKP